MQLFNIFKKNILLTDNLNASVHIWRRNTFSFGPYIQQWGSDLKGTKRPFVLYKRWTYQLSNLQFTIYICYVNVISVIVWPFKIKKPSKSHILLYSLSLTLVNPNSVFFSFEKSIMKIFLFSFESYFTTYFDIKSQI